MTLNEFQKLIKESPASAFDNYINIICHEQEIRKKQQEVNKMKKFHITVTQILEDYFEAESEDEAVEIAKEAFDEVPIEIFVNEVMED